MMFLVQFSLFILPQKSSQLRHSKIISLYFFILQNLYIRRCPKIQTNPFEVLKNVRYIYNQ